MIRDRTTGCNERIDMQVWLNGEGVDAAAARLDAQDAAFQHGVGLFETMAARHGRVFRLEEHLARMSASGQALGLTIPPTDTLREAVTQALAANGLERARLRLTVTPGSVSLLRGEREAATPTVLAIATPPIEYDPAYYDRGVTVTVAGPLANPFDPMQGHKTLAYWGRLRTLREAAVSGGAETLWLSVTNHLASGAVSNVLLVKDGRLLTPFAKGEEVEGALPAPVLPGVTRAAVIQLAEEAGIAVTRRMLTIADLLDADEVMLTNSSWNILPVTRVEKRSIGDACVGPVTRRLKESLEALIEQETKKPAV
jgi:branched-chain amino acid aminotransferase